MIDLIAPGAAIAPADDAQVKVWDLPLRLFHWLLAATILLAFVSAEEGSGLGQWHVPAGWVAAILIGFRLVWGFIGGQHARFADFVKPGQVAGHVARLLRGRVEASLGHNPLGGLATLALLAAVAAVAWSGASLVTGVGDEDLHEGIANGLLVLVGIHVAAVIIMSLLSKDNLVRAMITGRKASARHPGAVDAVAAPGLAVPVAALAIAAGAYGVLQIDAAAFTPGAHSEAGEAGGHEADGD
jgi:cytochrome b